MAACAYRSLVPVLQERLAALADQRVEDQLALGLVCRVAARRMGRTWGGAVALACAAASFAAALTSLLSAYPFDRTLQGWATALLVAAPFAGLGVAVAVRVFAGLRLRARLAAGPELCGEAALDLARVAAARPLHAGQREAMRWERASIAVPMAAVSMVAPLSIHGVVWGLLSAGSGSLSERSAADFGTWIAISGLLVGHAHLVVLAGAVRWSLRLPACATQELRRGLHKHWGLTLLAAAGIACAPGIVLLGLPPLLVTVTGLVFLPAAFFVAARTVTRERLVLEAI